MERVTVRIPKQQLEKVNRKVELGKYPNQSEAIRSAVRNLVSNDETQDVEKQRADTANN